MGPESNNRKYVLNICHGLKVSNELCGMIGCFKHKWQVKKAIFPFSLPSKEASDRLMHMTFFAQRIPGVITEGIWLAELKNAQPQVMPWLSSINLYLPKTMCHAPTSELGSSLRQICHQDMLLLSDTSQKSNEKRETLSLTTAAHI